MSEPLLYVVHVGTVVSLIAPGAVHVSDPSAPRLSAKSLKKHSTSKIWAEIVSVTVRTTDELGTVLKQSKLDGAAASLNTPLSVTEKSASNSSRSIADELTPVTSCTPLGVANDRFVMSFEITRGVVPESSTETANPRPDSFAIVVTPCPLPVYYIQEASDELRVPVRARDTCQAPFPLPPAVLPARAWSGQVV